MIVRALAWSAALLLVGADPLGAHPGVPPEPHDLWSAWNPDPLVLLAIGSAAWLYSRGIGRLWRRAGIGRGVPRWRFWCYSGGLAALFLALVSPLDALGSALFSAHMVQHEVLILIAAPLLVLGAPLVPFLWALPMSWRRRLGGWGKTEAVRSTWGVLSHPIFAWVAHALAVWIWHAPGLYEATLTSEPVHVLQHTSFFGTALLFWWALLHAGGRPRIGYGAGVLYVFTTAVYGSVLGALLTFSSTLWYPAYAATVDAWGLSPLEDQQLGGLIMWVPFGAIYTLVGLALFAAWLKAIERRQASTPPATAHRVLHG